ncbi:hypothetical protein ACP4OV_008431 [Aristida adscensionis]
MEPKQVGLRPITTKKDGGFDGAAAVARERSSLAATSFRVYYSLRAGAVPFTWESKPGTPKGGAAVSPASPDAGAAAAELRLLPPISPPPSHQSSQQQLKGGRCRPEAAAASGGVVRALLGVLCIRRRPRSHRRPAPCIFEGALHP